MHLFKRVADFGQAPLHSTLCADLIHQYPRCYANFERKAVLVTFPALGASETFLRELYRCCAVVSVESGKCLIYWGKCWEWWLSVEGKKVSFMIPLCVAHDHCHTALLLWETASSFQRTGSPYPLTSSVPPAAELYHSVVNDSCRTMVDSSLFHAAIVCMYPMIVGTPANIKLTDEPCFSDSLWLWRFDCHQHLTHWTTIIKNSRWYMSHRQQHCAAFNPPLHLQSIAD